MSVADAEPQHIAGPADSGLLSGSRFRVLQQAWRHVRSEHARDGAYVLPIGIGIILLTLSSAAALIVAERHNAILSWQGVAESESRMLAAHAQHTLASADLVLRAVIDRANDERVRDVRDVHAVLGTREFHGLLVSRQKGIPQISVVSIVDLQGDMVNFTRNYPPRSNTGAKINLLERDYFQAHLNNPALELFLSVPVQNKGTGTWTFYLARKIRNVSGEMVGLVLVGIEAKYFVDFYASVSTGGTQYSMFLTDGTNLARYPGHDTPSGAPGQRFITSPVFTTLNYGKASAVVDASADANIHAKWGQLRIVAPSRVREYPLVVNVRLSEDRILKAWRRSATTTCAIALFLSALLLALTIAVKNLLKRNVLSIQALDAARARADRENRSKGYFLANMSHEIRTPLNAITGLVDVLSEQKLPGNATELIDVIRGAAAHLLTIVNDVLDFSRLDAGQVTLREEDFSLHEALESLMAVVRGLPGASRLALTCVIAKDVPRVIFADRLRLTQVLMNLLGNAVKFTKRGSVTLQLNTGGFVGNDCELHFSVKDTGIGLNKAMADRIFEPFEQGGVDPLLPRQGTGLGLSISKRIATAMGGELILANTDGSGSTFRLKLTVPFRLNLPVHPGQSVVQQPEAEVKEGYAMRILAAEDTTASQIVIRSLLESMGHKVRIVANGKEAVDVFEKEDFDAVFLDIQMPVMDGYHAARLIRQMGDRGGRVPIVALTAYAQVSDQSAALAVGITMYLSKPIRKQDVSAVLGRLQLMDSGRQASIGGAVHRAPVVTIDPVALNELAEAVSSEQMAAAVKAFVRDLTETAGKMKTQMQAGDASGMRRSAHRMIGLFAQFGAREQADLAAKIEAGEFGETNAAAAQLLDCVPAAIEAVQQAARTAGFTL